MDAFGKKDMARKIDMAAAAQWCAAKCARAEHRMRIMAGFEWYEKEWYKRGKESRR